MKPVVGWPFWIGVVVEDLDRGRRFYGGVLGLQEIASGDSWAWFDLGGNLFEVLARSGKPPYEATRFQVGFAVADIKAARQELIGRGVEPIGDIEGGPNDWNSWAYFRDPDGNVFEITQRHGAPEIPPPTSG